MNWDFLLQDRDALYVTTDSRKVTPGCVFVALKGEHFDGNLFVEQAKRDGAIYVIEGEHALSELQDLARAWRRHLGLPIIGITGTNGKTTTKELLAAVLQTRYRIHYTQGNYNNALGVPLTLLQLTRAHEMAVVEMGASHIGDIKELVDIALPDYGLITNVGRAHLQGFGGFEGVKQTKAELYDYLLAHDGVIFRNADNPHLGDMLEKAAKTSGKEAQTVDYHTIEMPKGTHLVGTYNAENIAAAICVGKHFGISEEEAMQAIRNYVPTNNRSQAMTTEKNELVVDAYNANPTSMTAAIDAFSRSQGEGNQLPQAYILGEMRELGDYSRLEHQNIVNMLLERKADKVLLVGSEYAQTTAPYPIFANVEALHQHLEAEPMCGYKILVKGSRGNSLEKILDVL